MPTISDFVLYAQRSVSLASHALVMGGDVGVRYVAASGFSGDQATVSAFAQIDPAHALVAPSVLIGEHAQVGEIETNSLQNNGANAIGQVAPFPAPMPPVPLVLSPPSSGAPVSVKTGDTATLTPGAYGDLTIADHGALTLGAGAYSFSNVTIGEHCQLLGDPSGVTIRVAGAFSMASWSFVAPASSAPAGTLWLGVYGGGPEPQPALTIDAHDHVTGLFAAPNGLAMLADHVQLVGALAGLDVTIGDHTQVTFQNGFPPPSAAGQHGSQQLSGYVAPPMSAAPYVGPVPASTLISLAVGLPVYDAAALRADALAVSDRTSPMYRQYLTPDEFTAKYGPSPQAYADLGTWAQSAGLAVDASFTNNMVLGVSGPAATVERAFYVGLNYYARPDGTQFYALDRDPSIDLATPVLSIEGLNDYFVPTSNCQPDGTYLGDDFRDAYVSCRRPGLDGSGQTIAIVNPPRVLNEPPRFYPIDIQT